MITISIEGVGNVEVDDRFLELNDEQQNRFINRIVSEVEAGRTSSQGNEPPEDGGTIVDKARQVGQGVTFGFGDEIEAAIRTGGGVFGNYERVRDDIREQNKEYAEQNPLEALGFEIGGAVVPTAALAALTPLTGGASGVAATANAARLAASAGRLKRGVDALGKAARGGSGAKGYLGLGAGEGALYGYGKSEEDALSGQVLADTLIGTGTGAIGGGVAAAVGRAFPKITAKADSLIKDKDAPIRLTPAQATEGGVLQGYENTFKDIPLIGKPIQEARGRALLDFNFGTALKTIEPLKGVKIKPEGPAVDLRGKTGSDLYNAVRDEISRYYEAITPHLRFEWTRGKGGNFIDEWTEAFNTGGAAGDDFAKELRQIFRFANADTTQKIMLKGKDVNLLRKKLGQRAYALIRSPDPEKSALGHALYGFADYFDEVVAKSSPKVGGDLQKLRRASSNLYTLDTAIVKGLRRDADGVFTPKNLLDSALQNSPKKGKAANKGDLGQYAARASALNDEASPGVARIGVGLGSIGLGLGAGGPVGAAIPLLATQAYKSPRLLQALMAAGTDNKLYGAAKRALPPAGGFLGGQIVENQ